MLIPPVLVLLLDLENQGVGGGGGEGRLWDGNKTFPNYLCILWYLFFWVFFFPFMTLTIIYIFFSAVIDYKHLNSFGVFSSLRYKQSGIVDCQFN
jgi:hypothetical protein